MTRSRISKCGWCGQSYRRRHNRQVYCSSECRTAARQEQSRTSSLKYYHTHKNRLNEDRKYGLGSGGLGQHAYPDFDREHLQIQREMRRLRLKVNI